MTEAGTPQSVAARVFARLDVECGVDVSGKAVALVRLLLVEAAVHGWVAAVRGQGQGFGALLFGCAVVLSVTAASAFLRVPPRAAVWVAFATMVVRLVAAFPHLYNHLFLEAVLMGAAACFRADDRDEGTLLLQFTRGAILLVLFWSGLQKLLHGCYFGGEFLAVSIASNPYFAAPFTWLAPDEVARLQALLPLQVGAGPFAFESRPLVALSNLVWIAELTLPIALLIPATRAAAIAATLLLLVGIESAAREFVFGLLFAGGILSFTGGRIFERAVPWLIGALGLVFLVALFAPDVWMN